jgi:hypothetical protein
VLSGDMALDDNVIRQGAGADLIVHDVIAFSDRLGDTPEVKDEDQIIAPTRAAGHEGRWCRARTA